MMSNAALVLTDCPAVRKTLAGAYAAIAKQSIVKIIRSVQSFLSVSHRWAVKCQRIGGPLRTL
ncbi:hypothetical protein MES4922_190288 [Mesorhizobium ventifaucium]|uniref:Uncharacterized protein n=1 Tax=Mesorhizobium ventifaucium TaxID=666020 RepID=A0ABN8JIP8_9HYPH|nr:hypothetical protein MES4922_190288 [Mesorhizobium ventifaucium]